MPDIGFEKLSPAERASARLLELIRHSDTAGNACNYDPWPYAEASYRLSSEGHDEFFRQYWSMLHDKQKKAEKKYSGPLLRDPSRQHRAATRCLELRPEIERGDGGAVLEAIAACAAHGLVVPAWLAEEFVKRFETVAKGDVRGWEDSKAFGALPKGASIAKVRAIAQLQPWAYEVACQLMNENAARPLAADLYEAVGQVIGVGKTQAETYIAEYVSSAGSAPLKYIKEKLLLGHALGVALTAWQQEKWDEFLLSSGIDKTTYQESPKTGRATKKKNRSQKV